MFDLDIVAAQMRDNLDAMSLRAVDTIYDELPDYDLVPRTDVYENASNIISTAIVAVELGDAAASVAEMPRIPIGRRYGQGVSIESAMRASRICINIAQLKFRAIYRFQDLPLANCLIGLELMWQVSDLQMQHMVLGYGGVVGQRRLARVEFLRALSSPTTDENALVESARRVGLNNDDEFVLLLARTREPEQLVKALESTLSTSLSPAVAAELDGYIASVVPTHSLATRLNVARTPVIQKLFDATTFAASRPAQLIGLPAAWDEVLRVMASIPSGAAGYHDLASQSWRIAVPEFPDLARYYLDTYLNPLPEDPEQRDMLIESTWRFIDAGCNYRQGAAALFIHENTLRHRIRRFEEATGVDVMDGNTRMELMWLRQALELGMGLLR